VPVGAGTVPAVRGLGTVVNVVAVVAGAGVGLLVGQRLPERLRTTVLAGVGLITLGVGLRSFLVTENAVFPIVAIVAGAVIGEALRIEDRLEGLGEAIRRRVEGDRADVEPRPASFVERERDEVLLDTAGDHGTGGPAEGVPGRSRFVDGFVTASLTFCVGALTIVGSLQDGISGDAQLLIIKSALDGLVAIVFATIFGWGVAFSAVSIAVLQGSVTAFGALVGDVLSDRMVLELEATGGVMIIGIGLRLLELKAVPVASYLPGLAIAPLLVWAFAA
jgi:uncharacterized protein